MRKVIIFLKSTYNRIKDGCIAIGKRSLSSLNFLINKLYVSLNRLSNNDKEILFDDLSPVEDYEENKYYCERIEWALRNENVKNIALSGIYGSGKSSILKSFINNHCEYKYLEILMANFSDDDLDDTSLERGILQQLFYKVKYNKVPYSRFRKINKVNLIPFTLRLLAVLVIVLFGVSIFKPSIIQMAMDNVQAIMNKFNLTTVQFTYLTAIVTVFFIYIFFFIFKTFLSKINFKGVSLSGGQVSANVGEYEDKSIFNQYIDEIIYFFQERKFNVVIFEDLDRFNNIEIFTKIRQLNILLNNAEQINNRIVFIYSIKDDIFNQLNRGIEAEREKESNNTQQKKVDIKTEDFLRESKLRTKFFDFIIPVIPQVTSYNANQIISKKLNIESKYREGLDDEFIEDITYLINDMRLLKNICNEYFIYFERLKSIKKANINNKLLFSMIVYKNVYPKDFSDLQIDNGIMHYILSNDFKQSLIEERIKALQVNIENLEEKIKIAENETARNIRELRMIYILELLIKNDTKYFVVDGERITIGQLVENTSFNKLYMSEEVHKDSGWKADISSLREKSTEGFSYKDRENLLRTTLEKSIQDLKEQIEIKKDAKLKIVCNNLRNLISIEDILKHFNGNAVDIKLIAFLVANGHIDENYHDYITYFHEGKLTLEDDKFIKNNMYEIESGFEYRLIKLNSVMRKMKESYFDKKYSLNFILLDYIINDGDTYKDSLKRLINQLSNESSTSIQFVEEYIDRGVNTEVFINIISSNWRNFIDYVINKSKYSKAKKNLYIKNIISNNGIETLKKLNKNDCLKVYLEEMSDFLDVYNDVDVQHISNLIEELNISFKKIEEKTYNSEMLTYLYRNNYYTININMLKVLLCNFGNKDVTKFNEQNYTSIIESNCEEIIKNIEGNMDEYIVNVFLALDNKEEPEETFIELLNTKLDSTVKEKLIDKMSCSIAEINKIDEGLWRKLFNTRKIEVSWMNVFLYYENNGFDKYLGEYLNNEEVCTILSQWKMSFIDDGVENDFETILLGNVTINANNFKLLAKSMIKEHSAIDCENISKERVDALIDNNLLECNENIVRGIKDKGWDLYVNLIINKFDQYLDNRGSIILDLNDYKLLIESETLSNVNKEKLIEIVVNNNTNNEELAECIYIYFVSKGELFTMELARFLMPYLNNHNNKLNLFISINKQLTDSEIAELVVCLNAPYSDIVKFGFNIELDGTDVNKSFYHKVMYYNNIVWKQNRGNTLYLNTRSS